MCLGIDLLHLLLRDILVSEGAHPILEVVACHHLDLHATSIPVVQEGKNSLVLISWLSFTSHNSLHFACTLYGFKILLVSISDVFTPVVLL